MDERPVKLSLLKFEWKDVKAKGWLGGEVGGVDVAGTVDSSVLDRGPTWCSKSKLRPESEISEVPIDKLEGSSRER